MRAFRLDRLSVKSRLFLAIFTPSMLVLLLATTAAFITDIQALRSTLERQAAIDAEILAQATRDTLTIGDPVAAVIILSALRSNSDIRAAAIYRNGTIFATYPAEPAFTLPHQPRSGRFGPYLDTVMPIISGEEQIGQLWLEISLHRFYARLRYYSIASIAAVGLLSLGAAVLAGIFQRQFSTPLEALAETAQKISGERDYSVRAAVYEAPEFKALTHAFNHMLDRIERQNQALTDRTVQLEKANLELSRTNKELEAFTYTVSHDLRTPLRAISSYSELLHEEIAPHLSSDSASFMERIQKNAVRMAQLIDELLAFSRLDAHPLERTEVDLGDLARQVWNDLASQTQTSATLTVSGDLPPAAADRLLIRQVLANLLGNALKYSRTREQPRVEIGCFNTDGETVYFAKDNGVGFNMHYASKLFGIFQRLHSEEEFEGTGVGLAIVHRIITRHGGRIWAHSEPDNGATFFFTLGNGKYAEDGHPAGRG